MQTKYLRGVVEGGVVGEEPSETTVVVVSEAHLDDV